MSKKIIGTLLFLSLISMGIGYVLVFPDKAGLCEADPNYLSNGYSSSLSKCLDKFPIFTIGEPLMEGSLPLAIIFLILLFCSNQVILAWCKFASWFVPISIVVIIMTPTNSSSLGISLNPDKEIITQFLGAVYAIISLGIIIYKIIRIKISPAIGAVAK